MFRASGSIGASFYVEDTRRGINPANPGRPKPKTTNTVARKNTNQSLLKKGDKVIEKNIAQMKKEKEALNRKIEKEEEARLARLKKEKEELNRNIKREEEERKRMLRQGTNQLRPKKTVRGKKEEIVASRKIIKEEKVYVRRYK